jgi:hypothetical protein
MSKPDFSIVEIIENLHIYGLSKKSSDRVQAGDIQTLANKYHEIINKNSGEVIPFFVLSKDYNERTKEFDLFVGGLIENNALEIFVIPKGLYGKSTIKPKWGFLWGLSIGEAKRIFYTGWLPKSDYTTLNMEYEYHTEISKGRNPTIDILFAVRKRAL